MTRPRRSPIGYVFIALMSASLLSGCGTKFGSKLSEGTSRTLSGLKSGAKNVEKSLKGERYEKEMAAVKRRFKRIPSDQICWQARQEISRSWVFKISKKFVRRNKESDFGNRFWTELTANFYNTVDSALPLSCRICRLTGWPMRPSKLKSIRKTWSNGRPFIMLCAKNSWRGRLFRIARHTFVIRHNNPVFGGRHFE